MRLPILLVAVLLLLSFGCIEEKSYPGSQTESILSEQGYDLDQDGILDYEVYEFSPRTISEAGLSVKRYVMVATYTNATYLSIKPNLTDVDLIVADQALDEFSKSRTQSDSACSNNIGLFNVVCSDVTTCSRLCSGASVKCKKIATVHEEVLADSMISYVQANNEIRTQLLDARRMVLQLREAPPETRDAYLAKIRTIIGRIAEINANPLYAHPDFSLCTPSDYGVDYLVSAAKGIGTYSTSESQYRYTVVLSVEPAGQVDNGDLGVELGGIGITDSMPVTVVQNGEQVSSMQDITATTKGSDVELGWASGKPSNEGYMLAYEFTSTADPQTAMQSLKSPTVMVRTFDLSGLAPINMISLMLHDILDDYYLALGAAIGVGIAFVFLVYNIAVLALSVVSERASGGSFTAGFRKAFGRTEVRWKTDLMIGIVFLAAGYVVSSFAATQPLVPPPLLESLDFLIRNDVGFLAFGLAMIGVVLVYFSAENLAKIVILEKAYGMVIRHEKDMFLAKAATLKDKIAELGKLVEDYGKEEFDVSKEYDILTSVRSKNIDSLTTKMTAQSKAVIDEQLTRVDNAIDSLRERKGIADENWPKWRENIARLLDEQNEVYTSTLITIPASLRGWALSRYVREVGIESLAFERDSIKKKRYTAEQLVGEMIRRGLIKGAVIMRHDKVETSEFADGNSTVMTVLALKLKAYMDSLAKNLGQHEPQSFASVGEKTVILFLRDKTIDSFLFLPKDRFKDAVGQWKTKVKILESG